MKTMIRPTGIGELRKYIRRGGVVFKGDANEITRNISGDRDIRTVAKEVNIYYFNAKPKNGGSEFRVYCIYKSRLAIKSHIKNGKRLWYITAYDEHCGKTFVSKDYHTKTNALKARKRHSDAN